MRQFQEAITVLDAKASTGIGTVIEVSDFTHVLLALATANSANLTVKVQGSIQEAKPDFAAAQSPSNIWDYLQVKDLEDASAIDGDVGFAPAGTDDNRQFEVNVNAMKWLCLVVTARVAGSVTALAKPFSNQ